LTAGFCAVTPQKIQRQNKDRQHHKPKQSAKACSPQDLVIIGDPVEAQLAVLKRRRQV
jgi:hypothetical protein